jgi:hypothetical protein
MAGDDYIRKKISEYRLVPGPSSAANKAKDTLTPLIIEWASSHLVNVDFSGSYAKDTAIKGATDVDLFISFDSAEPRSLKDLYDGLYSHLLNKGYFSTRKQNVSIGVSLDSQKVDLIPAKRQDGYQNYFSLWKNKQQTWTQTNVKIHIDTVVNSGRLDEIRALKLWRLNHKLDFPSFYLEMTVMQALKGRSTSQLADNVWAALQYIRDNLETARVEDPANTNNLVSDDLTPFEKSLIASAAKNSLTKGYWEEIIW